MGDQVIIFCANEIRSGICHGDFCAQHIEFRHRARIESVALILQLIAQQTETLFGNGDQLAIEQHGVKLLPSLRDHFVHCVAEDEQALVFGDARDFQRRLHLPAGIKELLGLDGNEPAFISANLLTQHTGKTVG